nr:unnamed protein product [Digitaria exilis]
MRESEEKMGAARQARGPHSSPSRRACQTLLVETVAIGGGSGATIRPVMSSSSTCETQTPTTA